MSEYFLCPNITHSFIYDMYRSVFPVLKPPRSEMQHYHYDAAVPLHSFNQHVNEDNHGSQYASSICMFVFIVSYMFLVTSWRRLYDCPRFSSFRYRCLAAFPLVGNEGSRDRVRNTIEMWTPVHCLFANSSDVTLVVRLPDRWLSLLWSRIELLSSSASIFFSNSASARFSFFNNYENMLNSYLHPMGRCCIAACRDSYEDAPSLPVLSFPANYGPRQEVTEIGHTWGARPQQTLDCKLCRIKVLFIYFVDSSSTFGGIESVGAKTKQSKESSGLANVNNLK